MPKHFFKRFGLLALFFLGLAILCDVAPAGAKSGLLLFSGQGSQKADKKTANELPVIPQNLEPGKVNEIIAGLSDDQVRRLLIQELMKSAAAGAKKPEKVEQTGFNRIIQTTEENITLFHKRLTDLQSGAVAVPDFLPRAYADLRGKGGASNILLMFGAIAILLAGGLGADWLFGRYAGDMRQRLTTSPPAHWTVKAKRLLLCAAIDFMSLCVFCAATLALFFAFFNRGPFARLVLMTYLVVVLSIRVVGLLSSILLAPKTPALRWLPLEEGSARYLHRWVMRVILVLGVGVLVRVLLQLQGISEESVILVRALVGAVVFSMVVYLVFANRESVARIICLGAGDRSVGTGLLRAQLASFWHLLTLPYLLLTWVLWVFYLLVGRDDLVVPILALFYSVPMFMVFDGLGQRLLSAMFGFVDKAEAEQPGCEVEEATEGEPSAESANPEADRGVAPVSRLVPILRRCLSLSIVGILFFWLLELWGFEVRLGEQVTGSALKILLIVSLAYVAWRLIEEVINRKMKAVQGNVQVDEDSEMGGTGGSRLGTLLQIFRKFLLIVLLLTVGLIILSAMGIDTKPLLAGAGIVGLAIGLGTQNLIKDIVSGLFFLIDDAFRIGDYVESGKAKGTVTAISIRSLTLRHTRGQVHTVPFSQLGMVTNFSRDYNIIKLDFRVPFGTDIDQVRKIVKKINKEIQADEEMAARLLGPVKFAGVLAYDDSALVMRVKFMSKPGLQFLVQRQVFRRLQELFSERGLAFATRHVTVRMPDEGTSEPHEGAGETPPASGASSSKTGLSAAAGAAIAMALADEEAKKKQMAQEAESS